MAVGQQRDGEQERQADPRKEVPDHRVARSDPGLGKHIARLGGMLRAQQVEARHRLAHQSDGVRPLPASARCQSALSQGFFAMDDLVEAPLERVVRPQRLPHCQNRRQHRERSERCDRVIEADAGRQPVGDREILKPKTPHISNFAILFMIKTPVASIVTAIPSRISPRTS